MSWITTDHDTLIFQTTIYGFRNQAQANYRKYLRTTLLVKWDQMEWIDSFAVLQNDIIGYYTIGDVFFLKLHCNDTTKKGLKLMEANWFTLNGIPLRPESTFYTLLLAFNFKNNTFICYPKIEFTEDI